MREEFFFISHYQLMSKLFDDEKRMKLMNHE